MLQSQFLQEENKYVRYLKWWSNLDPYRLNSLYNPTHRHTEKTRKLGFCGSKIQDPRADRRFCCPILPPIGGSNSTLFRSPGDRKSPDDGLFHIQHNLVMDGIWTSQVFRSYDYVYPQHLGCLAWSCKYAIKSIIHHGEIPWIPMKHLSKSQWNLMNSQFNPS